MNEGYEPSRALVLFSGGQDSATCLAWALKTFDHVETVAFDYGQRHSIELECRKSFINALGKVPQIPIQRLSEDHLIDLKVLGALSDTSLTRERAIEMNASGLPSTFVPGRNLIFLTFAAALAYRRNCRHIILGVCETDYSGYPDCRDDTIKAMQIALNLGLEQHFILHTPLMWRNKAQTFSLAYDLGGEELVNHMIEYTHTCYLGERNIRHSWGHGCGVCPACNLRKKGWERWIDINPNAQD